MIDSQVTNISNTTMGQMAASVDNLNKNMNELSTNINNTSTSLNKRYDTTDKNIRKLNDIYGSDNQAKDMLNQKVTTFTGEMLNIFNNIKDYVKK
jgi:methyl-accepting chemotaxis protein